MGKRVASRWLAGMIVAALAVLAPMAGVALAGEAGGSGGEVVATLTIDSPGVSVKKADAQQFKPAKDGQKLKQGDTVKTDATGKAEIDYSADAYTRLDVNTTFTIAKLTEEEGERQIEGSLEEGRTWNRTAAVTESGSFEQSGGGATAAVTGTAFPVDCTIAAPDCLFTGVEGTFILKGNGEDRTVTPFQQCGSTDGDLCDEVRTLTADEMAAILWIQENLLEDLIERGLGTGPIIPNFTVVVEDGVVVDVIQEAPPATEETTTTTKATTTSTTTTTAVPPAFGDDPVTIIGGGNTDNPGHYDIPTGAQSGVTTEDETTFAADNAVQFTINVVGESGHVLKIKFTAIPGTEYGRIYWSPDGGTSWNPTEILPSDVVNETLFDSSTVFQFVPVQYEPPDCQTLTTAPPSFDDCFVTPTSNYPQPVTPGTTVASLPDGTVQWTTHFEVVAVDVTAGGVESTPTSIPITIVDDICGENPNRDACVVATSTTTTTLIA